MTRLSTIDIAWLIVHAIALTIGLTLPDAAHLRDFGAAGLMGFLMGRYLGERR